MWSRALQKRDDLCWTWCPAPFLHSVFYSPSWCAASEESWLKLQDTGATFENKHVTDAIVPLTSLWRRRSRRSRSRRHYLLAYSFPVESSFAKTTWNNNKKKVMFSGGKRKRKASTCCEICELQHYDSTHGWEGAFTEDSAEFEVLGSFLVLGV